MVLQEANTTLMCMPSLQKQEGYTALMKASVSSSITRVLDALLAAGANKEATDNKVNGDGACLTARTERRFGDIAGD